MDSLLQSLIQLVMFLSIIFGVAAIVTFAWEHTHMLPQCRRWLLQQAEKRNHIVNAVLIDKCVDPIMGIMRIYEYKWNDEVYVFTMHSDSENLPQCVTLYFWMKPDCATLPEYIGDNEIQLANMFLWISELVIIVYCLAHMFAK